ncbi:MAG: DUF262 domain-containing protein [Spirochaetes bacterium]|uniref:DUF262 domain-containing protein n=1 Tax=Candidatus Aphodenecus pullistercoris TaxID=2840669 RepID=A0A9D9H9A1_9SPIR|nr:DUF262 domain-containing protein [Candidatus Aphodenecus pullistercoris]
MSSRMTFLELTRNHVIQIPDLQRDYAQGRVTEKEKRQGFVAFLSGVLKNGKADSLGYIYGVVDRPYHNGPSRLTLIDGQQRLTTLFLLHWYLAAKDGQLSAEAFRSAMTPSDGLLRFSYETRASCRDFCMAMVKHVTDLDLSGRDVSTAITGCKWFYMGWNDDPTVTSMLIMLDCIGEALCESSGLYQRLCDGAISFDLLILDGFGLEAAGDLYIKMNSRGKALTNFEMIKSMILDETARFSSGLEAIAAEEKKIGGLSPVDRLGWLFDVKWSDAAYRQSKDDPDAVDGILLSLVLLPMVSEYMSRREASDSTLSISFLAHPSTSQFGMILHGCDEPGSSFKDSVVFRMMRFIDSIVEEDVDGGWRFHSLLPDGFRQYCYDDSHIFEGDGSLVRLLSGSNRISYGDLLKFFAYYLCVSTPDKEEWALLVWMRFAVNMIENSLGHLVGDEESCKRALDSIRHLYEDFVEAQFEFSKIEENLGKGGKPYPGLDYGQLVEEILKWELRKLPLWAPVIDDAEQRLHSYFKGQLSYALFSSGLLLGTPDDAKAGKRWYDDDIGKIDAFKAVVASLGLLFCPERNSQNSKLLLLLSRALLTKGLYMMTDNARERKEFISERRYSLLCPSDRDFSWKRFLQSDSEGRTLFDDLFNGHLLHASDMAVALRTVIDDYSRNTDESEYYWRYILVTNDRLFDGDVLVEYPYQEKRGIWNSTRTFYAWTEGDDGNNAHPSWIYPLREKMTRITSFHSELTTLHLYTKLDGLLAFGWKLGYRQAKTIDGAPCVVLHPDGDDRNRIQIEVSKHDDDRFAVEVVLNCEAGTISRDEVVSLSDELGFEMPDGESEEKDRFRLIPFDKAEKAVLALAERLALLPGITTTSP